MSIARYMAFRLAFAFPVLIGILAVTFFITHVLPTNPAALAVGPEADDSQLALMEKHFGLDKPITTQFYYYVRDLVHGDFGTSTRSGVAILPELVDRLASTLVLITLALPLAFLIGVGVAILAANRRGVRDVVGRGVGTFGVAVPDYLAALALILVFYVTVRWAPAPLGQRGPFDPSVPTRTHAYVVDAILAGNLSAIGAGLTHLVLPIIALGTHYCSAIYRQARAAIEEALRGPYVDYVVMMGGSPRMVWKAVVGNALPPVLTITGVILSHLLGGAVLIEIVFGWGGLGQYAVEAIQRSDYYAVQGFVLFAAVFSVLVYLAVDLLHAALDPRVRRSM